jgi:hypothetical protein
VKASPALLPPGLLVLALATTSLLVPWPFRAMVDEVLVGGELEEDMGTVVPGRSLFRLW